MAWHSRRNQLIACAGTTVQVFSMKDPGNYFLTICFIVYNLLVASVKFCTGRINTKQGNTFIIWFSTRTQTYCKLFLALTSFK